MLLVLKKKITIIDEFNKIFFFSNYFMNVLSSKAQLNKNYLELFLLTHSIFHYAHKEVTLYLIYFHSKLSINLFRIYQNRNCHNCLKIV